MQFGDEQLRHKFPADSGFTASYRFTIEKEVETLVDRDRRPDLYTITCNGQPVAATPGQWWLDRSFGKVDIASAARVGDNTVTIKAGPMTLVMSLSRLTCSATSR